jgi:hypothetical protein
MYKKLCSQFFSSFSRFTASQSQLTFCKFFVEETTTLVHLLMTKKQGNKSDYLTKGNLKRKEDKIWEFFFRTERKMFHKKYYELPNYLSDSLDELPTIILYYIILYNI